MKAMKVVSFLIFFFLILLSCATNNHNKIIAHRGYWQKDGSHENTLSSLKHAISLRIYGSECDVRQTADSVLILFHNSRLDDGRTISKLKYSELDDYRLSNGEIIPTLDEALMLMQNVSNDFKLIIEIKDANIKNVVSAVERYGVQKKVEYIAFGLNHCLELISLNKDLKVSYLASNEKDAWTPKKLKENGFWGLDYSAALLNKHPEWIKEAHDLGLDVNVWTVNDVNDISRFLKLGVDKITTDIPYVK